MPNSVRVICLCPAQLSLYENIHFNKYVPGVHVFV